MDITMQLAEDCGWFVTWFFNRQAWQASYNNKPYFRGDHAKTRQEAEQAFLAIPLTDWPSEALVALITKMQEQHAAYKQALRDRLGESV